jgi:uncharacterized protein
LAYPSRGGFGGESGGDPLRGQHRRVPLTLRPSTWWDIRSGCPLLPGVVSGRSPVSGIYAGKDEVLGLFGKLMERSGGTFRVEALDILANDVHGVVLTFERGQRDGKTLENHAVHVWNFRHGKCAQFRGYNEEVWDEFWS